MKCSIQGGGLFGPPPSDIKKTHIRETNSKHHLIVFWKIYNFYIKYFQVRSILRSPEPMSSTIKCFGISCLYNFCTEKHRDIKLMYFLFLLSRLCKINMQWHSQVNLKFDPRSRSGHSPMRLWGIGMLHTKQLALTRRAVWYQLQVFSTIMSWFILKKIYDVTTWPQMTFPGAHVNKRHQDHHRWDNLSLFWKNWMVLTHLHKARGISIFSHRLAM